MKLTDVTAYSDVGRQRDHNEDAATVLADVGLLAVADGMGGLEHGEIASSTAIEVLRHAENALRAVVGAVDAHPGRGPRGQLSQALRWLTDLASQTIQQVTRGSASGTTLVIGCVAGGHIQVVNTGDSRAYLLRDGKLRCLTDDHTVAAAQLRAGRLTQAEHDASPYQHMLYQALGTQSELDPDVFEEPAAQGDVLVLCSDGLSNPVPQEVMERLLNTHPDLDRAAAALVAEANQRGGPDNITVVLARITEGPPAAQVEAERAVWMNAPLLARLEDSERRQLRHYLDRVTLPSGQAPAPERALRLVQAGTLRGADGAALPHGALLSPLGFGEDDPTPPPIAEGEAALLVLAEASYDLLERQRPLIAARLIRACLDAVARRAG